MLVDRYYLYGRHLKDWNHRDYKKVIRIEVYTRGELSGAAARTGILEEK